MNIDNDDDQNIQQQVIPNQNDPTFEDQSSYNQSSSSLQDLVEVMQTIDTESPEAQLNATSMEDNNGKRIEYSEDSSD